MRIFKSIIGKENPFYNRYYNLDEFCQFFNILADKYKYHRAKFDSFMASKLICKLIEF